MSIRCLGCMKLKEKSPVCEHCGYNENVPNYAHQLPIGTVLREHYLVGKALGQGGFGITYIGWDQNLDLAVAIKEYYPNGIVNRESTHSLSVSTSEFNTELYQHNRERFLREARALARLSNVPGIVGIYNFFPENNTAYIIMEYVEGIDLKRYIKAQGRPLTPEEAFAVLRPVMDSLSRVHEAGLVHRDISPDNIMIQRDGKAKLLDFGAVREVGDAQLDKNLSRSTESILKHGYAPIEQYQRRGNLGPWTDVYALCATVYYCLTQETPPDAPERMIEFAEVEWDKIPGLTEKQVQIFAQGMAIMPRDRYHSIAELRNALFPEAPEPKPEPKPLPKPVPEPEPEPEVALTVNAVVEATVISHITEQNQKKQEEILPEPKAVQISLEERRLQQEKLEQQRKAQEEKQRREVELQEQRRLELEEKQRQEEARKERRRQEQLEKQLLEQEAKELRKKAQLEKQRREAELREKRRLEQEEKLHREKEQKEQRRQAQIRLQEEKRQRQIQEQKDKQEQLELRRQKRLEEKQRKEAESAGRSIHKILIPVLAVIAVMLTTLLLMPKGEDGEQMQVQVKETVGVTIGETTPSEENHLPSVFVPEEVNCLVNHPVSFQKPTQTYTYQSWTENGELVITGDQLSINVQGNSVTVTVSGLDIQDTYLTNLSNSREGQIEYEWFVFFVGEETCAIVTEAGCHEGPGANVLCSIDQMSHSLYDVDLLDAGHSYRMSTVPYHPFIETTWNKSSITWRYTISSDHPFDFSKLKQVIVHEHNRPKDTFLCRVYNPTTGVPAASSDMPCMDCGDWREDSAMYGYQTGTRNGSRFVEGENLSITVNGSNDVSVTLSGLDIRDSYPVNLSTTGKDMMEYGWHVTLHGEDTYRIGTSSWAFAPGQTETRTLDQMQNSLWDVAEDGSAKCISNVYMDVSWDKTSITWHYIIPSDHPFDFTKLKQVSVHVDNIPEGIDSCWVYNPQVAQISAGVEDVWKENVMMAHPFTDFDQKETVTTVTFLDTVKDAPEDCWDISYKQNGSVLAWMDGTELYIGAEGGIAAPEDCSSLFNGWKNLQIIEFNGAFHTEDVTTMSAMFIGCHQLRTLDLSSFNTGKVTDMSSMFQNCFQLSSVNFSGVDTALVTDMNNVFTGCANLDELDLSGFDTSNVTSMRSMFLDCMSLKKLNLSGWNTGKVTDMTYMFRGCSWLSSVDVSNFDASSVTNYKDFMDEGKTINGQPWEEFFEK